MMILSRFTRVAALCAVLGLAACSQSVGPHGVRQDAGPFHQSVGPHGVEQRIDPPASYQRTSSGPGNGCKITCRGKTYSASCPTHTDPACQCDEAPYAACYERR